MFFPCDERQNFQPQIRLPQNLPSTQLKLYRQSFTLIYLCDYCKFVGAGKLLARTFLFSTLKNQTPGKATLFPIPEIFQKISKEFTQLNVRFFTKSTFVKKNPNLRQFQTQRVVGMQQLFNLKSQISNRWTGILANSAYRS